jgi:hypothetical protein
MPTNNRSVFASGTAFGSNSGAAMKSEHPARSGRMIAARRLLLT